jgi:hypothetical protein
VLARRDKIWCSACENSILHHSALAVNADWRRRVTPRAMMRSATIELAKARQFYFAEVKTKRLLFESLSLTRHRAARFVR